MNKTFTGTSTHCKVSGILPKSGLMTTSILFDTGAYAAKQYCRENGDRTC